LLPYFRRGKRPPAVARAAIRAITSQHPRAIISCCDIASAFSFRLLLHRNMVGRTRSGMGAALLRPHLTLRLLVTTLLPAYALFAAFVTHLPSVAYLSHTQRLFGKLPQLVPLLQLPTHPTPHPAHTPPQLPTHFTQPHPHPHPPTPPPPPPPPDMKDYPPGSHLPHCAYVFSFSAYQTTEGQPLSAHAGGFGNHSARAYICDDG